MPHYATLGNGVKPYCSPFSLHLNYGRKSGSPALAAAVARTAGGVLTFPQGDLNAPVADADVMDAPRIDLGIVADALGNGKSWTYDAANQLSGYYQETVSG